jgi:luciferase family oxidoreductase group 1
VLIGPVAAATERIRVGSGGVMLPHYSPFKVAESFSLLSGLYPGRIDLGIGRASGTDPLTTYALQRDRRQASPDDFPQQLAELLAHFDRSLPSDHPFARLGHSLPGGDERPEVWLLGSSAQSAVWAAQLDLPYAFADFINPNGAEIAAAYRERAARPHVAVGLWAICAETDEEAERLASSIAMSMAMLRQNRPIPVPPPEKALRYLAQHPAPSGRRRIVGSPDTVRAGIEEVVAAYRADEAIVVTITHDHGARRRSYELIAEAFELARDLDDRPDLRAVDL